jgi:hypothetical protein
MTDKRPKHAVDPRILDRADNRWENLREATHGQNRQNTGLRSDNLTKGVTLVPRKGDSSAAWLVHVRANGKTHCRTCHGTLEDAAESRAKLAKELHQEFTRAE